MDCIDKPAVDGAAQTVTLALRNNIGFGVNVTAVVDASTLCAGPHEINDVGIPAGSPAEISNNGVFRVKLVACNIAVGDKFDQDVTVSYINIESGLANKAIGAVRGRAG